MPGPGSLSFGTISAASGALPFPEGDPGGLRAAARAADRAGGAFERSAGALRGATQVDGEWSGQAAQGFATARVGHLEVLRTSGDELAGVAEALQRLARTVEEAQDEVRRLAWQVTTAEEAADRAQADATAAQGRATAAASALMGASPEAMAAAQSASDSAGAEAGRAASAAADAKDHAEQVRRNAERDAQRLCNDVERQDSSTAGVVDAAASCMAPLGGSEPGVPPLPTSALASFVARKYAPIFRFDSDEDHFPDDVLDWIAGERDHSGDLGEATLPFTYHVTEDGELQLEYGRFHPFNDFPDDPGFSDHEGDFEPFTIQFGRDGRPSHADFESHGHTRVVDWPDVDRDAGDRRRPVVYPSHGGHGNNAEPGRYDNDRPGVVRDVVDRLPGGGVGDHHDEADGQGRPWNPRDDVVDARQIPELWDDREFGTVNSFTHPDQGPPPDLDGVGDDDRHEDPVEEWDRPPGVHPRG